MRAITIREPYATLIAAGAKRIETRSWAPAYRGPLLIHAALGPPEKSPHAVALARAADPWPSLPTIRGHVVAVAWLSESGPADAMYLDHRQDLPHDEYTLGFYGEGRCGLLLTQVARLDRPIPAKGALSLWTPGPLLEAQVRAQVEIPTGGAS